MPVVLYSAGFGWLLGHRFLLLVHRGRKSGRIHRTVLEIVEWNAADREAIVVSGFGPSAQWYRNVLAVPPVEVRVGRDRFAPTVRQLESHEASNVLARYERRNRIIVPIIRKMLSKASGVDYDGSPSARTELVEALPMVAFRAKR